MLCGFRSLGILADCIGVYRGVITPFRAPKSALLNVPPISAEYRTGFEADGDTLVV